MARSKSSSRWLQRHVGDPYVRKAQQAGYRSRAAYKLLEINERDRLLRPGLNVLDLGAAPGGWSQVAAAAVGEKGRVIAMDILSMDSLPNVVFLQGDFREQATVDQLLIIIDARPVDLVISDMAPNISGVKAVDQPRGVYLAELALDMACKVLVPGGTFLVKMFQGEGSEQFRRDVQQSFEKVMTRKPKASRAESSEVYLLARNYKL